ncbi:MAG: universal stress protein [Armatimonadetes bacterium]|nr:universal stress protein [Armatimonadota bacterium]
MYTRILVPLDGSPAAEAALPHAREIARRFGARVLLLRVVEPLVVPAWPSFAGPDLGVRDQPGDATAAEAYIREQAAACSGEGVAVESRVRRGPSADEILACIGEEAVDLVVMAAHGRGGFFERIAGRTAEAVLARTPVPVLVVPTPRPASTP